MDVKSSTLNQRVLLNHFVTSVAAKNNGVCMIISHIFPFTPGSSKAIGNKAPYARIQNKTLDHEVLTVTVQKLNFFISFLECWVFHSPIVCTSKTSRYFWKNRTCYRILVIEPLASQETKFKRKMGKVYFRS